MTTKEPMTEIDFAQLSSYERYKLMASLIVPRPIALVTTLGADGTVNAAPFSMFNMMGEDGRSLYFIDKELATLE